MIETHHLVYAGVLLVFLTGAATVALTAFLFIGTGLVTAIGVRFIKHRMALKLRKQADRRANAVELPLPMEEALRQVAAGNVVPGQGSLPVAAAADALVRCPQSGGGAVSDSAVRSTELIHS
jgi:hypothetical protein